MPAPEPVSAEEVAERLRGLVRQRAPRSELPERAEVGMGDEVLVDLVGYAFGRPLPGSAEQGLLLYLEPGEYLPGLSEGLVGLGVGESREVSLTLPADFALESLRGAPATYRVRVRKGYRVEVPDMERPEVLRELGLGDSLEQVLAAVAEELAEELDAQVLAQAEDLVLAQLLARSEVHLPEQLVTERLEEEWNAQDGACLRAMNVPEPQLREALEAWKSTPALRQETRQQLSLGMVLAALVEQSGLELSDEGWEEFLEEAAADRELTRQELEARMEQEPNLREELELEALHHTAVLHVLSRAEVHIES
jgi:trigger factor